MSTLQRTLGWIAIGAINGTSLGAVLGTCLGWFTVGCNVPGNAVALRTARVGAALGGIAGILACACWAARKSLPWRFRKLTVFVGVGGILFVGMILPAVALVTNAGARIKSSGSLKQIGLALHNYHHQHGSFPSAVFPLEGEPPEKRLSWFVGILPYLERQDLFDSIDRTKPWDAEENRPAVGASVFQFWNPYLVSPPPRESPGLTYYVGIAGVGPNAVWLPLRHPKAGYFGYERRVTIQDVTDGISNTMMVVDTMERNGPRAGKRRFAASIRANGLTSAMEGRSAG